MFLITDPVLLIDLQTCLDWMLNINEKKEGKQVLFPLLASLKSCGTEVKLHNIKSVPLSKDDLNIRFCDQWIEIHSGWLCILEVPSHLPKESTGIYFGNLDEANVAFRELTQ